MKVTYEFNCVWGDDDCFQRRLIESYIHNAPELPDIDNRIRNALKHGELDLPAARQLLQDVRDALCWIHEE